MSLSLPALALTSVVAAAAGAALGWWPLTAWVRRELRSRRPATIRVRVASAIGAGVLWGVWAGLFLDTVVAAVIPALFAFAACGTVLAVIDVIEQRLPNRVLLWTTGAVALLLVGASTATGAWMPLLGALLGAAGLFVLYLVIALLAPRSFGMGDVKLAVPVGLLLGWFGLDAWLVGLVLGAVVGGVFAVISLVRRARRGEGVRNGMIPYGPAMLTGTVLAVAAVGVYVA
jgi:leader peptidase (prepilin peptidase)/N-methyltransferase